MRIKLTESQIRRAVLITEGQEVVHTFLKKADDIKEDLNRMYSKLAYTTLSEIIDGDMDLSIMINKLIQKRTVMETYHRKGEMFFKELEKSKSYTDEWGILEDKFKETYIEVFEGKLYALDDLLDGLKKFSDENIDDYFKDIKRIDL